MSLVGNLVGAGSGSGGGGGGIDLTGSKMVLFWDFTMLDTGDLTGAELPNYCAETPTITENDITAVNGSGIHATSYVGAALLQIAGLPAKTGTRRRYIIQTRQQLSAAWDWQSWEFHFNNTDTNNGWLYTAIRDATGPTWLGLLYSRTAGSNTERARNTWSTGLTTCYGTVIIDDTGDEVSICNSAQNGGTGNVITGFYGKSYYTASRLHTGDSTVRFVPMCNNAQYIRSLTIIDSD